MREREMIVRCMDMDNTCNLTVILKFLSLSFALRMKLELQTGLLKLGLFYLIFITEKSKVR